MGIYIPPEEANRAKEIGCYEYFRMNRPSEVKRHGRDYCHVDHDSFCMKENGAWWWHSRGLHGSNAISFLMDAEGMSFQAAVMEVLNTIESYYQAGSDTGSRAEYHPRKPVERQPEEKKLLMPERDTDTSVIRAYLEGRGIDPEVINHFISQGTVYQDARYKSVCFVGSDAAGNPRLINVRGTRGSFKGNLEGSDRRYAFMNHSDVRRDVHLFEAPIDLLSYATIIKESGKDFRGFNLVSMSGICGKGDEEEIRLPICMEEYLGRFPETTVAYIHFDNDAAGHIAGNRLQTALEARNVQVRQIYPPAGYKDVNDFLTAWKEQQNQQQTEASEEADL